MPIPESYYDFLKPLPLNDPGLLVCNEFSEFINRFEYCELFSKAQSQYYKNLYSKRKKPEKSLLQYFDEEKIAITEEERKFLTLADKVQLTDDEYSQLQQMSAVSETLSQKYKEEFQKYADKYISPDPVDRSQMEIDLWKLKDSILVNTLELKPNLVYETAKIRSLDFAFKNAESKEKAAELWAFLKQDIINPYLLGTGNTLFDKRFPSTTSIAAKQLPNGPGTDVFRKIISPYKGKVLFVDFWAISCGPCVSGIKQMKETREKYMENPDFEFIFITDERSSPEKYYTDFVKDQQLKNTYRISTDDFNLLRQLFRFNGIPHYVVIDQNGDVINDEFELYSFETELGKLLPAYKK